MGKMLKPHTRFNLSGQSTFPSYCLPPWETVDNLIDEDQLFIFPTLDNNYDRCPCFPPSTASPINCLLPVHIKEKSHVAHHV